MSVENIEFFKTLFFIYIYKLNNLSICYKLDFALNLKKSFADQYFHFCSFNSSIKCNVEMKLFVCKPK